MSSGKACVRCGRGIDSLARICPYCNWSQDEPIPAVQATTAEAVPAYVPPSESRWKKPIFSVIGGVLLLVSSFVIGVQLHSSKSPTGPARETPVAPPDSVATRQQRPTANVTLVPDNGPAPGQPITSAPVSDTAQGLANQTERADATGVSSAEYAQMEQRAVAEQRKAALVDPLTIRGMTSSSTDRPRPAARRTLAAANPDVSVAPKPASEVVRTPPVPEYQPIPELRLFRSTTTRLIVTIDTDGRVTDVNVVDPVPGQTGQLIAAVQRWRFKPATENGRPIPSSFSTAISFNANE